MSEEIIDVTEEVVSEKKEAPETIALEGTQAIWPIKAAVYKAKLTEKEAMEARAELANIIVSVFQGTELDIREYTLNTETWTFNKTQAKNGKE